MNRSGRKRRTSCAEGEVCPSFGKKEEKTLLTRPASLEIPRLPGTDCAGFAASEEWYSLFLAPRGIFPSHLRLLA